MSSSCPNAPDMDDCKSKKKRCLTGPCVGQAYTAGSECPAGAVFNPATCQCDYDNFDPTLPGFVFMYSTAVGACRKVEAGEEYLCPGSSAVHTTYSYYSSYGAGNAEPIGSTYVNPSWDGDAPPNETIFLPIGSSTSAGLIPGISSTSQPTAFLRGAQSRGYNTQCPDYETGDPEMCSGAVRVGGFEASSTITAMIFHYNQEDRDQQCSGLTSSQCFYVLSGFNPSSVAPA